MSLSPPSAPEGAPPEPSRDPRPHPGTGAELWLFRHGRVTAPTQAYGSSDVPLSDEGEEQTRALAKRVGALGVAHVRTSPLVRARTMGEAVAGAAGVEVEVDARLAEMGRGRWQGLDREEYARRWHGAAAEYWSDTLHWQGHGGESEAGLVERAWPALLDTVHEASGGLAFVTAHRQVLRACVAAALGLPPAASHRLLWPPAHGVLLRDDPAGWTLVRTAVLDPSRPRIAEPADGPPQDVVPGQPRA